jgi:hypothetical protein
MSFRTLLTITGLLGVVFGLAFLVAPAGTMQVYGTTTDPTGLFMARFFGAALVYAALLLLALRNLEGPFVVAVARAACIGELVGLWVALRLQFSQLVNGLGWSSVAIYGLLAVAFGMIAFRAPAGVR